MPAVRRPGQSSLHMDDAVVTGLFALGGVLVGGFVNGGTTAYLEHRKANAAAQKARRLADGYADRLNLYALRALAVGTASDSMRRLVLSPAIEGLEALREDMASLSDLVWSRYLSTMTAADVALNAADETAPIWQALSEAARAFEDALGFDSVTPEQAAQLPAE